MANTIKLKKDGSANATPTVNSNGADSNNGIVPGEVAINYRDGKLYSNLILIMGGLLEID